PMLGETVLATADQFIKDVFGQGLYSELEAKDLAELWEKAKTSAEPALLPNQAMREWRSALRDHPKLLYDAPNAASILVHVPRRGDPEVEGVALALSECTPGRITRRWGLGDAHWIPVLGASAVFGSPNAREMRAFSFAPNASAGALLRLVPSDAAKALG